jgi:hypothetical protein
MAYGGSTNIDPVLASMGMAYGGTVTPMGGMPMGMGGMFGGMMPGMMGGYAPGSVPAAPLPPGVSSYGASPFAPVTPTEDNFNGKILPLPDQDEKKKRNTQNILLAAGIAISSIALLALTHGRGARTAKKQATEDADRLREGNRKTQTELANERERSSARKQALNSKDKKINELTTKYAVLERQAARASQEGNVHAPKELSTRGNKRQQDILKSLPPEKLAQLLIELDKAPKNLKELQESIPWIHLPSRATDSTAMKEQANAVCHSIVFHGNTNALPLIREIGKMDDHLPNSLLKTAEIDNSADRMKVLDALFHHRKLTDKMTYPKYDLTTIGGDFKNRTKVESYPHEKVKNTDETLSDKTVMEEGTVGSFIEHYQTVLQTDIAPKTKVTQETKIAELQKLIHDKTAAEATP